MLRARGIGTEGTEKNQRSDEGVLDPVRKGWGEVGESKIETEVEVKMACPLGRRRGGDPDEGMGQGRVGEEIARDRGGFERERELPCDVGGAPNRQRRAIG